MAILSRLLVRIAKVRYRLLSILFLVFAANLSYGQTDDDRLSQIISYDKSQISLKEFVSFLDSAYQLNLTYNSSQLDEKSTVNIISGRSTIESVLKDFLSEYKYDIKLKANKIIVILHQEISKETRLYGRVVDKATGESLVGVILFDEVTGNNSYTNNFGLFNIPVQLSKNEIRISYIGYETKILVDINQTSIKVYLENINKFSPIVILDNVGDEFNVNSGAKILDVSDENFNRHLIHQKDLINVVKSEPSIQSGNEGQNGYIARGGAPDQNLILLDDIPLYEVSHALGLNSLFMNKSLKSAELLVAGMPVRYGDKLSSVLDVKVKKGNKDKLNGSVSLGLTEANIQLDGPIIKNKTTFNIAARHSLYDLYLPAIVDKFTTYNNVSIDYYDILAKLTHRFSETSNIELLMYRGEDVFSIGKEDRFANEIGSLESKNSNSVEWGTELLGLHYNNTISNDVHMTIGLSATNFGYNTTGNYSFENKYINEEDDTQIFNLYANSKISNVRGTFDIDYYYNTKNRFRFGAGWDHQVSNPAIIQNTITYDGGIEENIAENPNFVSSTFHAYFEDTYYPIKNLGIYAGVRYTSFTNAINYRNFQPRLKILYQYSKKYQIIAAYDNTVQYNHLLVNPGLGVPSDLWVPSTEEISPQKGIQYSLAHNLNLTNNLRLYIAGYYKILYNQIEYTNPVNVFFVNLNSNNVPILADANDWQKNVVQGRGKAYGIEFNLRRETEKVAAWVQYKYSRNTRTFEDLNDGRSFPFRYDRPHDLQLGFNYNFSSKFALSMQYIYGSGNRFSLSLEEFDSVSGVRLVSNGDFNNYQLPAYQVVNIYANYKLELKRGRLSFDVGIYNVLNRYNAYYVYLYSNPLSGDFQLRKVSLFPFVPKLECSYIF